MSEHLNRQEAGHEAGAGKAKGKGDGLGQPQPGQCCPLTATFND
ncbi:MAG: hypothetical protein WAM60_21595 [Candidatus Promineifilaceae bacterium]